MDELINTVSNLIQTHISANKNLLESDPTIVSKQRFEDREKYAPELEKLISSLNKIVDKVNTVLNDVTVAHQNDLSTMDQMVTKNKPRDWASTVRRRGRDISLVAPSVKMELAKPRVKITESLSLPVIKTTGINGVRSDGELYYIESLGQFAFKLSGHIFRGNIGVIFTDTNENHTKIKDCKYAKTCMKGHTCDYYHDPMITYGSQDKRNFIANNFAYIAPENRRSRHFGRRFGSLNHLDTDIINMDTEEVQKYQDMAVHDMLCSLLLAMNNQ